MLLVRKYKGNAGCITGIVGSKFWPYLACCSTDRFVRLYKMEAKEPLRKVGLYKPFLLKKSLVVKFVSRFIAKVL